MMSTTTDQPIDLTSCDREPIHVPGRVQPHGVLLVLAEPDLRIIQASTSTAQQLGRAAESLLGQPLAALLGDEYVQYLRNTLALESIDQNPHYIWTSQIGAVGQHFDGLIHRHNGALILELEPSHTASAPRPDFYRLVKTVVARLQGAPSFDAFSNTAVAEVRAHRL